MISRKKIRGMVSPQTFTKRKVGRAPISREQPRCMWENHSPRPLHREKRAWHVESHGGSQTAFDSSSKHAFASGLMCKVSLLESKFSHLLKRKSDAHFIAIGENVKIPAFIALGTVPVSS